MSELETNTKFEDGSYQCLPGPALIAKVLAGRCKMNYTRAAVGQGIIPEGVSPKSLTEPPDYVMDAKISAVTNPIDGECQVTVQIKSDDVETGFYAMGILLYAEDPDLGEVPYTYLKLEDGLEWIRPASSAVGKLATFDLIAAVGAVDAVSASIDPDAIATYAAVKQLIAETLAPSGTGAPTEDTPGVVGGRYFDAAAKREYICVEVVDGKTVWRPSGGGSVFNTDITIPADGWAQTGTGRYSCSRDIPVDGVTARMIPNLTVSEAGEATAIACGLAPRVQTVDGAVRVFAANVPAADIPACLTLQGNVSGLVSPDSGGTALPVATANRVGMVKPGAGLNVAPDGTMSVDFASDAEVDKLLTEALAPDNK